MHDDRPGRGVDEGGPEVPLVLAGDDDQQSLVRDEQTRTAACLLEQRLAADDGAELLGTIVAGELEIDFVPEPRRMYGLVERLSG